MLPILPCIGNTHALASFLNKTINAIFFSKIYVKCNIDVFCLFVVRKLRLKYKKQEKSTKSLLPLGVFYNLTAN